MARRAYEPVDDAVQVLMTNLELAWRIHVLEATSAKTLEEKAFGLRTVTNEMLKYAETSPILEVGSVSRSIDAILSRQYFETLQGTNVCGSVIVEMVHGVLKYGLARIHSYLERSRNTGTDKDVDLEHLEDRLSPLILWEVLGHTMLHAMNTSLQLKLVLPRSLLGALYISDGYVTALEVVCRQGTAELYSHGRRPTHGSSAIQLASTLSGSLFLIGWAVRPVLSCLGPPHKVCLPVCLSYLGTILKFQRLIDALIERRLERSESTDPISQRTSNMLHNGMHTLVTIHKLLSVAVKDVATGNEKAASCLEMRVNQALVAGHYILSRVRPHTGRDLDPAIGRIASRDLPKWVARIGALGACDRLLGCHNPRCVNLESLTESAMVTRLCGGCRMARAKELGYQGLTLLLDMCSGTGSVARGALWAGFDEVWTIDNDPERDVTDRMDILDVDAMHALGLRVEEKRKVQKYRVAIHGSPPCQEFSQLGLVSRSNKPAAVNADNMKKSLRMVNAVIAFAMKHADVWSLENPGTGTLWTTYASKIHADISRQVRLDICRYGSVMKKNTIIAFSCDEVKQLFGPPLECLKDECLSLHANPKTGFTTQVHVAVNLLPLSQRIAFPEVLSMRLMSAAHSYLRTLGPVPDLAPVLLIQRVVVAAEKKIVAYRDINEEDGKVYVQFMSDAKTLWHRLKFEEVLQHDFTCDEIRKAFCRDSGLYVVEKIVGRREGEVFIKWKGFPAEDNSWEPAANFA